MDWWNELWLNEGFATWVGWLAVDHFYPGKNPFFLWPTVSKRSNTSLQSGISGLSLLYATPEVMMNLA